MKSNKGIKKQAWYSLPLHQNPKAILPLYLAGFGSLCWQAVALFLGSSHNPDQDRPWEALTVIGIVFMFLGFGGSFIYRHYRIAALALIVSLISPPLWYSLFTASFLWVWFPLFMWLHFLPVVSEYSQSHPVIIWLCFQIPLAVLILWCGSWPRRIKARMTILAAGSLICFFTVVTVQARREVAASPHISADYLSSTYAKHDTYAIKRLTQKRIVMTGAIFGADDGLIGSISPYQMNNDIQYDDLVGNEDLKNGDVVSIIGTLEGKDAYGEIHFADSRVVK